MAFGVLCDLRVQHDYWLNQDAVLHDTMPPTQRDRLERVTPANRYIELFPTRDTQRVMAGHGILFKSRPTGARLGIELMDGTTRPRRPLAGNRMLRFGIRLRDPSLVAYSAGIDAGFYVLGNRSGNARGGALHLSQPLVPFQPTRRYSAGEIRAQYQGARCLLFQARRDTGPAAAPIAADWQRIHGDTHDGAAAYLQGNIVISDDALFQAVVNGPGPNLNNAADWAPLGVLANQYISAQDQLPLRAAVFSVDVQSLGATTLRAEVTRTGNPSPFFSAAFSDPQGLNRLPIDLRGLEDGRYRLDVLDSANQPIPPLGQDFYLSAEALAQGWFGVIEIDAGAGAFALLDGAGQLNSPRFDLRFLNTAARVRYRFPAQQPVGTGADVAPDPVDTSILITPAPRPVTHHGAGLLLRADDPATPAVQERILLPHPAAQSLRKHGDEWICDLHLSNFPPLS